MESIYYLTWKVQEEDLSWQASEISNWMETEKLQAQATTDYPANSGIMNSQSIQIQFKIKIKKIAHQLQLTDSHNFYFSFIYFN